MPIADYTTSADSESGRAANRSAGAPPVYARQRRIPVCDDADAIYHDEGKASFDRERLTQLVERRASASAAGAIFACASQIRR